MSALRTFLLSILLPALAAADVVPGGAGIIYGEDHVFSLTAPKDWSLDNTSAVKQGIHAAFFPMGSSWAKSKVVAYARSRPIDKKVKSIQDAVDSVLADFHANGSPDYKGEKDKEIKAESGRTGIVYKFTGDKWGNFEAVCYFKEEKTINFVVLSSREKGAFDDAWDSYIALCKSYLYISDHYEAASAKDDDATDEKGRSKAGQPAESRNSNPVPEPDPAEKTEADPVGQEKAN